MHQPVETRRGGGARFQQSSPPAVDHTSLVDAMGWSRVWARCIAAAAGGDFISSMGPICSILCTLLLPLCVTSHTGMG